MTKKERIEELERRVAQLEAEPHVHYMPYWSVIPPVYGQCAACGRAFYAGHCCTPIVLWPNTGWTFKSDTSWTVSGGNIAGTAPDVSASYSMDSSAIVAAIKSGGLN